MNTHLVVKLLNTQKHSPHNTKRVDQILSYTITTGLIHTKLTFNCILRAYSQSPKPIITILMYNHFINAYTFSPDNYTYPVLLKACARANSISNGKLVHAYVKKLGLDRDIFVQNALVHFYGTLGKTGRARFMFDEMPQRHLASWNSILGVLSSDECLVLFREMIGRGVGPDSITLVIVFSALAKLREVNLGSAVHGYAVKFGLDYGLNVENAMLGMYEKCGMMNEMQRLYYEMDGVRDMVTHTIVVNGLIKMGFINMAREIFDHTGDKDEVLWNSMIRGYVEVGRPKDALEMFKKMENCMLRPDETTVVSVLSACAYLSNLEYGRYIHRLILRNNIKQDVFVGTALVDMYSKCGSLEEALVTFYKMATKDVFTWTTALEALAKHGYSSQALTFFQKMENEGVKANEATFLSVLSACRQEGLVEESCFLFDKMVKICDIQPKVEHFGCMIDLLSKAGMVTQAHKLIKIIPHGKNRFVAYKTLLNACTSYSKFDLGMRIANELSELGLGNKEVYVLLSNFYAVAEKWPEVEKLRKNLKSFFMTKDPGISCIELPT